MSQGLKTEADLSADELGLSPDIDDLVIEDDTPVDNLISEKQQRLLTGSLYSNENLLGDTYFVWEFGKPPDIVIEIVSERANQERQRADTESQRAEMERQRAEARATQLADQLRSLGIDPNL